MYKLFLMYFSIRERIQSFVSNQKGVTAIEYALIAVAISSVLFLVLGTGGEGGLSAKIKDAFKAIQDGLGIAGDSGGAAAASGGK